MMEGPRADSEEKQEPASDFDTALEDRLKALDLKPPIREADVELAISKVCYGPTGDLPRKLPADRGYWQNYDA